ncbi:CheB methylesterase domain-containing protein [Rhodobacter sp. Har01]|uniref:CheB methylesterase domain-containing protein n=1 Tax=Rhodobacter sp. Har01 TaxID=2883999 RepID=UPI001D06D247|nr:CheB methylesterase domain-containing protein [Rhodobacter sp. Har01]MCB6176777.1 CheB methylesterase domain-containing protein [Rhodobacter sp. Har01]
MTRILLACPDPVLAARLAREAATHPGISVVGRSSDPSSTYILAEREAPDVVLVARDLADHPDFEGLVSLFRVVGIAWVEVPLPSGPQVEETDLWSRVAALRPQRPAFPARSAAPVEAGGSRFRQDRLILIGASTGGIDALLTILSAFPADCPPTAIVQHTGAAFSDSLIRLFSRCSAARVVAAEGGIAMLPGTVVVAAGCPGHLRLTGDTPPRTEVTPGPAISGHLPSVDALFESATGLGRKVVAALLTGMGRDGARGLLALRRAGAHTIAQDAETSVIYGMPRAAVESGAAAAVLPLPRIAADLLARCSERGIEALRR